MSYIIAIIIIFIIINIFHRIKIQEKNNFLLRHVITALNHYEKVLLKNKSIKQEDIHRSRQISREGLDEKNFEKLKRMVVSLDPHYLSLLQGLIACNKDNDISKELAVDAVYYKNNYSARELLKIIEDDNIKEFKVNEDEWITDKYGKDFFTEE